MNIFHVTDNFDLQAKLDGIFEYPASPTKARFSVGLWANYLKSVLNMVKSWESLWTNTVCFGFMGSFSAIKKYTSPGRCFVWMADCRYRCPFGLTATNLYKIDIGYKSRYINAHLPLLARILCGSHRFVHRYRKTILCSHHSYQGSIFVHRRNQSKLRSLPQPAMRR